MNLKKKMFLYESTQNFTLRKFRDRLTGKTTFFKSMSLKYQKCKRNFHYGLILIRSDISFHLLDKYQIPNLLILIPLLIAAGNFGKMHNKTIRTIFELHFGLVHISCFLFLLFCSSKRLPEFYKLICLMELERNNAQLFFIMKNNGAKDNST